MAETTSPIKTASATTMELEKLTAEVEEGGAILQTDLFARQQKDADANVDADADDKEAALDVITRPNILHLNEYISIADDTNAAGDFNSPTTTTTLSPSSTKSNISVTAVAAALDCGASGGSSNSIVSPSSFLPEMPQWKKDLIQRRKMNVTRSSITSPSPPPSQSTLSPLQQLQLQQSKQQQQLQSPTKAADHNFAADVDDFYQKSPTRTLAISPTKAKKMQQPGPNTIGAVQLNKISFDKGKGGRHRDILSETIDTRTGQTLHIFSTENVFAETVKRTPKKIEERPKEQKQKTVLPSLLLQPQYNSTTAIGREDNDYKLNSKIVRAEKHRLEPPTEMATYTATIAAALQQKVNDGSLTASGEIKLKEFAPKSLHETDSIILTRRRTIEEIRDEIKNIETTREIMRNTAQPTRMSIAEIEAFIGADAATKRESGGDDLAVHVAPKSGGNYEDVIDVETDTISNVTQKNKRINYDEEKEKEKEKEKSKEKISHTEREIFTNPMTVLYKRHDKEKTDLREKKFNPKVSLKYNSVSSNSSSCNSSSIAPASTAYSLPMKNSNYSSTKRETERSSTLLSSRNTTTTTTTTTTNNINNKPQKRDELTPRVKISTKLQFNQFIIQNQQKFAAATATSSTGIPATKSTTPTTGSPTKQQLETTKEIPTGTTITCVETTTPTAATKKKMVAVQEMKKTTQNVIYSGVGATTSTNGNNTTCGGVGVSDGNNRRQNQNRNNNETEDFDPTEDLSYGPGIVSKLRCRYLYLAQSCMQKQRNGIDNLRRATSLNNLLDRCDDDDDDDDDDNNDEEDDVDDGDVVVDDEDDNVHGNMDEVVEGVDIANVGKTDNQQQQQHNKSTTQSILKTTTTNIVGGSSPRKTTTFQKNTTTPSPNTTPTRRFAAATAANANGKNVNRRSVTSSNNTIKTTATTTTTTPDKNRTFVSSDVLRSGSRHLKRGNDSLKRARSVEALLCDKNHPWNFAFNRSSYQPLKSSGMGAGGSVVTIEDKIVNARERLISGTDALPPKRLTSIIDDTERPPPDLVKQTLKKFEATANRRPRLNRGNSKGEVANKVANYKSIIKEQKPAIVFPKPAGGSSGGSGSGSASGSPTKKATVGGAIKPAAKPVVLASSPSTIPDMTQLVSTSKNKIIGGIEFPLSLSNSASSGSGSGSGSKQLFINDNNDTLSTESNTTLDIIKQKLNTATPEKRLIAGEQISITDSPVTALTKKLEKLQLTNTSPKVSSSTSNSTNTIGATATAIAATTTTTGNESFNLKSQQQQHSKNQKHKIIDVDEVIAAMVNENVVNDDDDNDIDNIDDYSDVDVDVSSSSSNDDVDHDKNEYIVKQHDDDKNDRRTTRRHRHHHEQQQRHAVATKTRTATAIEANNKNVAASAATTTTAAAAAASAAVNVNEKSTTSGLISGRNTNSTNSDLSDSEDDGSITQTSAAVATTTNNNKRITKTALDNIAKAGTTQQFKFANNKTATAATTTTKVTKQQQQQQHPDIPTSVLNASPGKQIGIIRPLLTTNTSPTTTTAASIDATTTASLGGTQQQQQLYSANNLMETIKYQSTYVTSSTPQGILSKFYPPTPTSTQQQQSQTTTTTQPPPPLTSREIEKNRINEMKKTASAAAATTASKISPIEGLLSKRAIVGSSNSAGAGTGTIGGSGLTTTTTAAKTSLNNVIKSTITTSSPLPTTKVNSGLDNLHELDASPMAATGTSTGTSSPLWATNLGKRRQTPSHANTAENTTMVFNFSNRKEVPDYIENDGVIFRPKRRELPKPNESGFVLLGDLALETSTDSDYDDISMGPPSPCDVEFENANIVIDGKSNMRQKSKEGTFRVQFNDTLTSTFEYPSEASLVVEDSYNEYLRRDELDSFEKLCLEGGQQHQHSSPIPSLQRQQQQQQQHHHVAVDEIIPLPTTANQQQSGGNPTTTPTKSVLGNLPLGSAPLGFYTPVKAPIDNLFQLGVTRAPSSTPSPSPSPSSMNGGDAANGIGNSSTTTTNGKNNTINAIINQNGVNNKIAAINNANSSNFKNNSNNSIYNGNTTTTTTNGNGNGNGSIIGINSGLNGVNCVDDEPEPESLDYLKPANDDLTIAYSKGTQKTDLLY